MFRGGHWKASVRVRKRAGAEGWPLRCGFLKCQDAGALCTLVTNNNPSCFCSPRQHNFPQLRALLNSLLISSGLFSSCTLSSLFLCPLSSLRIQSLLAAILSAEVGAGVRMSFAILYSDFELVSFHFHHLPSSSLDSTLQSWNSRPKQVV